MSAPVPVQEKYINVIGATFVIGSAGATLALNCMDGTLTHTVDVDDMTNNTSGGWYEDVPTINKMEGDVTLAYPSGAPIPIIAGQIFATTVTVPSGPTIAGNFRYNAIGRPMMNVKGGYKQTYKVTNQGAIVITN